MHESDDAMQREYSFLIVIYDRVPWPLSGRDAAGSCALSRTPHEEWSREEGFAVAAEGVWPTWIQTLCEFLILFERIWNASESGFYHKECLCYCLYSVNAGMKFKGRGGISHRDRETLTLLLLQKGTGLQKATGKSPWGNMLSCSFCLILWVKCCFLKL